MKYIHKKLQKTIRITQGESFSNGIQLAYSPLRSLDPTEKAQKSTLPTSPASVERNSYHHLRVLNRSIETFHCVNRTSKNS